MSKRGGALSLQQHIRISAKKILKTKRKLETEREKSEGKRRCCGELPEFHHIVAGVRGWGRHGRVK